MDKFRSGLIRKKGFTAPKYKRDKKTINTTSYKTDLTTNTKITDSYQIQI